LGFLKACFDAGASQEDTHQILQHESQKFRNVQSSRVLITDSSDQDKLEDRKNALNVYLKDLCVALRQILFAHNRLKRTGHDNPTATDVLLAGAAHALRLSRPSAWLNQPKEREREGYIYIETEVSERRSWILSRFNDSSDVRQRPGVREIFGHMALH